MESPLGAPYAGSEGLSSHLYLPHFSVQRVSRFTAVPHLPFAIVEVVGEGGALKEIRIARTPRTYLSIVVTVEY